MSEELEVSGSDVNSDASSAPSEGSSSEQSQNAGQEASSGSQTKQEQYVPYDRFKELVEQKNQFARQFEETNKSLQELRDRLEKQAKPAEPQAPQIDPKKVLERLKGIDPEFAQYQEYLMGKLAEAEKFQQSTVQERQAAEAQRTQAEASSTLDRLHTEYKVPKEAQDMYRAMVRNMALDNPKLGVKDLPQVYKQVHDNISKYLESQKRATLGSYTQAKTADSKVPGPAKGPAPKANGKFEYSKDREEAKSQMIKRVMEQVRAGKDS